MSVLLDAFPLARMQAGMIFHSELEQESGTYHDIDSYHLRAPLDIQLLQESLKFLTARHEILRTSFDLVNFSEPLQLIYNEVEIPFEIEDISHLSTDQQATFLKNWMELEKRNFFDWSQPPLLRVKVHRRSHVEFQLTLSFHHAILDGWSVAALAQELFQIYGALTKRQPLQVYKPTNHSFRDFVALEREALQSPATREFWEHELQDLPPVGSLFGRDAADPRIKPNNFGVLKGVVSPKVVERLKQLVRQLGVPMKSILLAAHLRVLAELTGQQDVTAGVVTHGRLEDNEGDQLLGLFLNTLPMRLMMRGGTWIELIRTAFQKETSQMPHRRFPVAEMQRLTAGRPLFNTLFNFNHFHHIEVPPTEGQTVTVLQRTYFERVNFPLSTHFNMSPIANHLSFALCYVKAWFTDEQAEMLKNCYLLALEAIAFSAHQRYEMTELLSADQRDALFQAEREKASMRYWQEKIGVNPPVLQLPTDLQRPATLTHDKIGVCLVPLSEDATKPFVGSDKNVNHSAVQLLTAWQVLLARLSSQLEFLIGIPIPDSNNTVMIKCDLSSDPTYRDLLQHVNESLVEANAYNDIPFARLVDELVKDHNPSYAPLCQALFVFPNADVKSLQLSGVPYDIVFVVSQDASDLTASLHYNETLFVAETVQRWAEQLAILFEAVVKDPDSVVSSYPLLSSVQLQNILVDWNNTATETVETRCIQELFEAQVAENPDEVAVVFENRCLSYRELNEHANRLSHKLRRLGVGPDVLVGLCMERSLEMMVGLLGILKAGGAYVPLDPTYPLDRLAYILKDANASVLVSQQHLQKQIPAHNVNMVLIEPDFLSLVNEPTHNPELLNTVDHLAYVIYTSGSTGQPKGVLIEHRSVVNFFIGMDERISCGRGDSLLAVTSICFDISVLELFWTLTRGCKVVLLSEEEAAGGLARARKPRTGNGMDFSLFYFAADESNQGNNKYRLLFEGAKFADKNGFTAVWTPERHFHSFGGLYPSPAVTSGALAMITERIQLRSGSIVLTLHNPIRVAEDWAVVDNFSNGRVALSFASGWHADDFVLQPNNYAKRSELLFENIEIVKKLWRGESLPFTGGIGQEVHVSILPRPIQNELPIFVTSSGSPETFRRAGAVGANLLTHLLGQSVSELSAKIAIYRQARAKAGYDPATGRVVVMLHTFVGENLVEVKEKVRQPFLNYLRSSVGLLDNWLKNVTPDFNRNVTEEDIDGMLSFAFDRYFETSGLLGTPESCLEMVDRLKQIGVDEVACLIDFGIDENSVMNSLQHLNTLRKACEKRDEHADHDFSLTAQAIRHSATLMQCTPSLMKIVSNDGSNLSKLTSLRALMLGGEALPSTLAKELKRALPNTRVLNMYGPTEATVWATTHEIDSVDGYTVPIGKPFANVKCYVLDKHLHPVPVGYQGELHIGGLALARGYHKRYDLTAEKFVRNPFVNERNARLYKTGDLVQYRPDGTLQFIRRLDHQVKLRGFRIELGEIESVLSHEPSVNEAVLVVREHESGSSDLVAYLVLKPGHNVPTDNELREIVKAKLPDYMVPSAFVWLDSLPLTANGKIDRRALPAPQYVLLGEKIEPRTEGEAQVAKIWSELLGREVGVTENFFEAGGHSLLSIQLIARLRDAFQLAALSLKDFYELPTVESIALLIQRLQSINTQGGDSIGLRALPELKSGMGTGLATLPLTPVQQNYFIGRSGYFDRSTCGSNVVQIYSINGADEHFPERLNGALNKLIKRHDVLRLFILENCTQQVLDVVPDYEVVQIDLTDLDDESFEHVVEEWVERQCRGNFPIDRWPLFDAYLLKRTRNRYSLVLRLDALLVEGSSLKIINEELYQLLEQPDAELPPLQLSFRDYAAYVAAVEQSETFAVDRDYWLSRLDTFPEPAELPMQGYISPTTPSDLLTVGDQFLDSEGAGRLQERAKQAGVSTSSVLTAAFCELLSVWSERDEFSLFLITTDRPPAHPEMQHIIGNFNSLLPVVWRQSFATFEDHSKDLQTQLIASLAHRTYTAHHLIREWNKRRRRGSRTAAAILFNSLVNTEHNGIIREQEESMSFRRHSLHWFVPQYVFKATVASDFDGSIVGNFEFVKTLFPTEMVETMLCTYKLWVQQLADTPLSDWKPTVPVNRILTPIYDSVRHHGYRVSLSELEDELYRLPEIRTACVVRGSEENAPLHAHIELHPGYAFRPDAFTASLEQKLPSYLLPDHWYLHNEIPKTADGQVDRTTCLARSLPADLVEPITDETEVRLAALYAEILPIAPASRHDDLFTLGGDSLLAVRLLKRIENEFGQSLPVTALVKGASVAEIAALINR